MKYILWTLFFIVILGLDFVAGIALIVLLIFFWFAKDDGYKKGTREDMFGNKY